MKIHAKNHFILLVYKKKKKIYKTINIINWSIIIAKITFEHCIIITTVNEMVYEVLFYVAWICAYESEWSSW